MAVSRRFPPKGEAVLELEILTDSPNTNTRRVDVPTILYIAKHSVDRVFIDTLLGGSVVNVNCSEFTIEFTA
tara:strand:+ start:897 stop:1112 length:216 start_codon:yes stop_codon:yes gene_type:complete